MSIQQELTHFCRRCGLANARVGVPCDNCSMVVEAEELPDVTCASCKMSNPRAARYCRTCGWELSSIGFAKPASSPPPMPTSSRTAPLPTAMPSVPQAAARPAMVQGTKPAPKKSGCGKFIFFGVIGLFAYNYFVSSKPKPAYNGYHPLNPIPVPNVTNDALKNMTDRFASNQSELGDIRTDLKVVDTQGQFGTRITVPARLGFSLFGKLKIDIYDANRSRLLSSNTMSITGKSNTLTDPYTVFIPNEILFAGSDTYGHNSFIVEARLTDSNQKVNVSKSGTLLLEKQMSDFVLLQSRSSSVGTGINFTTKYYFLADSAQVILHFRDPVTKNYIPASDPAYRDVNGNLVAAGRMQTFQGSKAVYTDATISLPYSALPRGTKSILVEAGIYDTVNRRYLSESVTVEAKVNR